jgi:hypothetical protein
MRVWKHKITADALERPQQVTLRGHVHIVAFGIQNDQFVFWAEEDPNSPNGFMVEVQAFGTGWPIPVDMFHVGTVQHGAHVWHLYYRPVGTVKL